MSQIFFKETNHWNVQQGIDEQVNVADASFILENPGFVENEKVHVPNHQENRDGEDERIGEYQNDGKGPEGLTNDDEHDESNSISRYPSTLPSSVTRKSSGENLEYVLYETRDRRGGEDKD